MSSLTRKRKMLNCKHTARMVSLYAAGDLVGAPEREVTAHLAACEECRRLAEEWADSGSLLAQACTPPEFGAEFYSGIRHTVLGEITRDRMLSQPSPFRRRWIYATAFAAVIVIASGVMLRHFGSSERRMPQSVALAPQAADQPTSGQPRDANSSPSPQSAELPRSPRKPHQSPVTPRVPSRNALALVSARGRSVAFGPVRKPNASDTAQAMRDKNSLSAPGMPSSTNASPGALESATFSDGLPSGRASAQVSRIEIQTANPNIRIIWLTSRESRESDDTNHDQDQHENGNRK
jgi:hypothetical protein